MVDDGNFGLRDAFNLQLEQPDTTPAVCPDKGTCSGVTSGASDCGEISKRFLRLLFIVIISLQIVTRAHHEEVDDHEDVAAVTSRWRHWF